MNIFIKASVFYVFIAFSFSTFALGSETTLPFDPTEPRYNYEKGSIWISSNVLSRVAGNDLEGDAMVCALSSENSYLSYRIAPSENSQEVIRLGEFAVVKLTGRHSDDYRWLEAKGFTIQTARNGGDIPTENMILAQGNGWVSSAYVCDFVD